MVLPSESAEIGMEREVTQTKWSEHNTGIENIWLKPILPYDKHLISKELWALLLVLEAFAVSNTAENYKADEKASLLTHLL